MSASFFYLINLTLLARLSFTTNDRSLTPVGLILFAVLQLTGLFLAFSFNFGLIAVAVFQLILSITLPNAISERDVILGRLAHLVLTILIYGLFMSPLFNLQVASWLDDFHHWLETYAADFLFIINDWRMFNIYLFGLLLAANESNIIIRLLFMITDMKPKLPQTDANRTGETRGPEQDDGSAPSDRTDVREFNAGRIIGILA